MTKQANIAERLTELRDRLIIDRHRLDDMLVEQPQCFEKASQLLAEATSVRDGLKNDIKVHEAMIGQSVREDLERTGKKTTEGLVASLIASDAVRTKMATDLLEAERELIEAQGVKDAFVQRAHALRDLCNLAIQGFYQADSARPPGPPGTLGAVAHNRAREQMHEKRVRRAELKQDE